MFRFANYAATLTAALLLSASSATLAAPQQPPAKPTPPATPAPTKPGPKDKPTTAKGQDEIQKLNKAVAPYVARAKKTYPSAKARYLKGLPAGQRFFVTYSLKENGGKQFEQVFIAVQSIKGSSITGAIANDLNRVKTYKRGQVVTFPEAEILDWTISRPDGTEEGNVVGNVLDTYKP